MVNKKPANRLSKSAATINTKKVVVKQDMIDFIKTQGMTKALKRAGEIKASGKGGEREFLEGVRRMYGQRRLDAAAKGAGPKMPAMSAPVGANKKPANRLSKSAASIQTKVGSKPAPKKGGMSTGAKITGAAVATAALIASRGKATGLASKLSPAVGRALGAKTGANTAANVMARKLASEGVKVGPKGSFGPSTAATAKAAGKNIGTKSEFAQKAMQDKARAYLASRAAAKTAPTKAAASKAVAPKPTLKKTAPKKRAMAAGGIGSVTLKGDTAKTKKK